MSSILHQELTKSILKIFFEVYNELGYGFLERVYQNALYYELKANGFHVEAQKKIKVYYKETLLSDINNRNVIFSLFFKALRGFNLVQLVSDYFLENSMY